LSENNRFILSARHLVVLALAVAAFLRFWQLDTLPPGLYHDEAYYALDALSLLEGKTFPIYYEGWELYAQDAHADRPATPTRFPVFFEGNYGREPLHVYLIALSIKLFGPTPLAIRVVSATAGLLGVLTTYLAAGAVLGRQDERSSPAETKTPGNSVLSTQSGFQRARRRSTYQAYLPALAAFALAILYPALTFSRFGIRAMLFIPIETLAVYCFWRGIAAGLGEKGMKRGNGISSFRLQPLSLWFAGVGVCLGLGLYTYAAARLFPLLFVVFVSIWFWRDRPAIRRYWRPMLLAAISAAVIAAPLLLFFVRYPYFFVFRTSYVANKGLGTVPGKPWLTWLGNVGRVFRGLFWQGEYHLRHNLPGRAYLDPIQALFFLLGLGGLLRPAKEDRPFRGPPDAHLFLLLWLVVMLLPTILSGDAPHFGRMTGVAPVVAILIAAGAVWLAERLSKHLSPRFALLIPVLFLASTGLTFRDYFSRYAGHPDLEKAFYVSDWQLGRYAAAQPPETSMYLTPTQEEMATIYYALAGQRDRIQSYYGPGGIIPAGRPGSPAVYFLRPGDNDTLQRLVEYFPAGMLGQEEWDYIPFHVPADAPRVRAEHPADVSWAGQIRLLGWSQRPTDGPLVVALYWQAEAAMDRSYTAFVHLLDSNGSLIAQLDRPPAGYPTSDWRPGEVVVDSYAVRLPPALAPGTYSLETGFYYLPTLEPLGQPARLGVAQIGR
jgi:4-amino-4-deoxy-L-arabinose transferase-like glycosyltransferase